MAKLIKLRIDKESDPENRQISVELESPGEGFSVDMTRTNNAGVYTVESKLKKAGSQISKIVSTFDSNNNVLNVVVNDKYKLNLGVFSEKLADLSIVNLQENKKLATGTMRLFEGDHHINYIELNLKWNRFWAAMQKEILKDDGGDRAETNEQYNSYLGDCFGEISKDLKPGYDVMAQYRAPLKEDCGKALFIIGEFYSNFLSAEKRAALAAFIEQKLKERKEANAAIDKERFLKRASIRYNQVSDALTRIYLRLRSVNKRLGRYVPKLPKIQYNSSVDGFANNVVFTRATRHAENLYQANAIYRNSIRRLSERFLSAKGNLARNTRALSFRALINKYKYKPLNSYTVAGMVFNRRGIIRFNGNAFYTKQCQYLLTHDLAKRRFTVLLSNNKFNGVVSVYAFGQKPIGINGENAFIDQDVKLALPYTYQDKTKDAQLTITKTQSGVRLEIEDELLVECNRDSNACIIGLTRFSIGKVNGLLGRSNYDLGDKDETWQLGRCDSPTGQVRNSPESKRFCYETFGRHCNSIFKNAFGVC